MPLHQIQKLTGRIPRVPQGVKPVLELELDDNQYLVGVSMDPRIFASSDRKTTDWDWVAYRGTVCG